MSGDRLEDVVALLHDINGRLGVIRLAVDAILTGEFDATREELLGAAADQAQHAAAELGRIRAITTTANRLRDR